MRTKQETPRNARIRSASDDLYDELFRPPCNEYFPDPLTRQAEAERLRRVGYFGPLKRDELAEAYAMASQRSLGRW